jgi:hypothetical protein
MFFEVRVYKADGRLKKTISQTELHDKHWKTFEKMESGIGLNTPAMKPVPVWVKHKLDLEFPSHFELINQSL